ncbi:hypothetical protein [uncultured Brevundimonas sp.]|uniref:hypothetical protein n=1 Tax=uncultured Brevundimonas sp. TaxID=213418 RepID=UPI0030EDCA39|tara:strand:- start:18849 stop:19361 length:513 start_codon:yes stop_codon:yes gene_type:complete
MSVRPPLALVLTAVAVLGSACASTPGPVRIGPPPSAAFNTNDFAWSARSGRAVIQGRVDYRQDGQIYECTGSVALTPDTPYTRARFYTLYGSIDRAAVPEAIVRSRTVSDPNADYRSFVRSTTCDNDRFTFTDLPDGGWFIITPVSAGGDRIVLMRRVVTRGGRTVSVTL